MLVTLLEVFLVIGVPEFSSMVLALLSIRMISSEVGLSCLYAFKKSRSNSFTEREVSED